MASTKKTATKTATKTSKKTAKPTATLTRKANPGFVSHTELASTDPQATRKWCQSVLGWSFGDAVPTPTGPYHMWRHEAPLSGGGIRNTNPKEPAGTTPFVEVADVKKAHTAAIKAGATEMYPPMAVGEGMGWISCVRAPGGPSIGFWSP